MIASARPDVVVTASPSAMATVANVDEPDVSIVIVTYGTGRVVLDAIRSLAAAPDGYRCEIVVVCNPHPELGQRTAHHLLLSTSGVRLVRPSSNTGFGGGCELGALFSRGRWLAFVNPDVEVRAGWLAPLVDAVSSSGAPTIASPVLLNGDGSLQEAGQRLDAAAHTSPLLDRPAPGEIIEVDYASAACWVVDRDVHEALGGFDPAYHPAYFEDVDLALRSAATGGRSVVVGSSTMTHLSGMGAPGPTAPANAQRAVLLERHASIRWRFGHREMTATTRSGRVDS